MAYSSKLKYFIFIPFLAACGHMPGAHNVKPKQEPVYNFTQSSRVLSCLGEKIDRTDKTSIDVFVSNIPDHTIPSIESGFLTKNAVMMVTTALDRLSTEKVAVIGKNGAMRERRQVQILGSFTELNRTVQSSALSGEAAFPGGFELGLGADKNTNHIALDLAMSELNRIIPKTATSVSIQINGNSGDATLTYDEGEDFAAIGALGFTGQEGFHSGQRLLIETSVALMMSKYFDVDIRSCLQGSKRKNQSPVETDYDEPVFPQQDLESAAVDTAAGSEVEADVSTLPRRTRPELTSEQRMMRSQAQRPYPIAPPSPQPYSSQGFYEAEPSGLQQQNGVYVLPRGAPNRFLRAQPREYGTSPSQESFSGVPDQNVPDPASGSQQDFLKEQTQEAPSSDYKVVF